AAGRGILPAARTDPLLPAGGHAMRGKRTCFVLGFCAVMLAATAWICWTPLYSKYVAYRVTHAMGSGAAPWVERGLQHPSADIRLRAIQVAMRPEVQHLEPVRALLYDPAAEVRQAALLALGGAPDIVSDEDLLPLLHDPDAAV